MIQDWKLEYENRVCLVLRDIAVKRYADKKLFSGFSCPISLNVTLAKTLPNILKFLS